MGFTGPHEVEVSFNRSGNYVKVMVGDSQKQKIELFPCSRREMGCSVCPERFGSKSNSMEKVFVRMVRFEEIFVENYSDKEVAKEQKK
jgi:hypothetical protein